jgi:branched-chain amino acid transport system substrate-binding protein
MAVGTCTCAAINKQAGGTVVKTKMNLLLACVLVTGLVGGVSQAASAADPYKIGVLHSFGGYLAAMGTASRDGFLAAIDVINKRGGVNGRPISAIIENDESDPAKGVPAAIRLMNSEKVMALVGPVRSDTSEALGPLIAKEQVVEMTGSFMLPKVASFTFSTLPPPDEEAKVAIALLKKKGAKTLAIIHAIDIYSATCAKLYGEEAERNGIKVVANESYNAAQDRNFIPQLTKFKAVDPEWMAILGGGAPVPLILKQKDEIGLASTVIGNLAFTTAGVASLVQIAGKNIEGAYFITLPVAVWETLGKDDPRLKPIEEFREAYKAKYSAYPEMGHWWIAQNYDIAFLLAEAIKKAGAEPTGDALRKAVEGINGFHGVAAVYNFSPTQHAGATGFVIGNIGPGGKVSLAQ